MEWNELSQEKGAVASFCKYVIYMFHIRQRIFEEMCDYHLFKE